MHQHRHLFERTCTLENLIAAGKAALRGKRMSPPGAVFLAEFEKEIFSLHEELWAGTYRHGGYTYFTIHEPKERLVAAAPFRDRVVHHAIVRVIEPIFEQRFIEDSFACRRGKGGHAAMRRAAEFARRWPYALKCDVRKYFPSIDHEVLMRLLQRVIADERLLGLLRHILDSHADAQRQQWTPGGNLFDVRILQQGLPIGNLTSQFFANVYLNPLDHFVKHELRVKGYLRYMDDFLLFGNDRATLRRQGREVRQKLAELRLVASDRPLPVVAGWLISALKCPVPRVTISKVGPSAQTRLPSTSSATLPARLPRSVIQSLTTRIVLHRTTSGSAYLSYQCSRATHRWRSIVAYDSMTEGGGWKCVTAMCNNATATRQNRA